MKTQPIGASDLVVARLSYGCMRIAGTWDPAAFTDAHRVRGEAALDAALEAGYTLFDHADIYARGLCETLFGDWLKARPGVRERIVIATKCGIRFGGDPETDSPHRFDFSREHIRWSVDRSLERLGVETIDLYQLHRPDALMDPAEIADAFEELRAAGKVRWFGVSNFFPAQVSLLQSRLSFPLVSNQVEISLARRKSFTYGTLDQCFERGMTPLAWSPLAGGWLGDGGERPTDPVRAATVDALDEVAGRLGVSRSATALAWLLRHPSGIVPIVGSTRPEAIRAMAEADGVEMSREDWYRLTVAARGRALP